MRYYTGDLPCIGCGKTGREKARLSKDSLCSDCRSTLRIGREVVEKRKLQNNLIFTLTKPKKKLVNGIWFGLKK